MASLQNSFYISICFLTLFLLLWTRALKTSDISAVIYFSFALTNITSGPRDFLGLLPTLVFTVFENPEIFHRSTQNCSLSSHSSWWRHRILLPLCLAQYGSQCYFFSGITTTCSTQVTHPSALSRLYFSSLRNSSYNRLFSKWQLKWLHGSLISIQKSCLPAYFYCFL